MIDEMTPQQRAVRVLELLRQRPHKAQELAAAVSLHRTSVYRLLNNLGQPVYSDRGWWFLLDRGDHARLRKIYTGLCDQLEGTPDSALILGGGALRRKDAIVLIRHLRRTIIPPQTD